MLRKSATKNRPKIRKNVDTDISTIPSIETNKPNEEIAVSSQLEYNITNETCQFNVVGRDTSV